MIDKTLVGQSSFQNIHGIDEVGFPCLQLFIGEGTIVAVTAQVDDRGLEGMAVDAVLMTGDTGATDAAPVVVTNAK